MDYLVGDIVLYDADVPVAGVVVKMITTPSSRPVVKFWDWEYRVWDTYAPALSHISLLARKGEY